MKALKCGYCNRMQLPSGRLCGVYMKVLFLAAIVAVLGFLFWSESYTVYMPLPFKPRMLIKESLQTWTKNKAETYEFIYQGVRFKKQFAYYVQTEECIPEYLLRNDVLGNHTIIDVYVLSFRTPCTKPRPQHLTYLFKDKTTWSIGRNILFFHVQDSGNKYFYHIFIDEDVELFFTDTYLTFLETNKLKVGSREGVTAFLKKENYANAIAEKRDGLSTWRHYEKALMEHSPAYAVINLVQPSGEEIRLYQKRHFDKLCPPGAKIPFVAPSFFIDTRVIGYHYKALPLLLPYNVINEHYAWAASAIYTMYRANAILYKQTVTVWGITSVNNVHRNYPRNRPPNNYMEQYFNVEGESIKTLIDKRDYDFVMFWDGDKWKDVFFADRAICTAPVRFPVTDHYVIPAKFHARP